MPARILNGNRIRDQILLEVEDEVETLTSRGIRPGLAAVRVGDDPASEIYVRNKIKACKKVGIHSEHITPPATATTEELLGLVDDLNHRDEIDGILIQLPLPDQVDAAKVLLAVSPQKDVDGFHPFNVGALVTKRPAPIPCTPAGLIQILKRSEISHCRQTRRHRGPERHCRQAHCVSASPRERDGDDLSFEDRKPPRCCP